PGLEAPDARLSDRVDGSFAALRARVAAEAGWDYLAEVETCLAPLRLATLEPNTWYLVPDT
ncbi:MAG TPA: hypothetical protein VIV60_28200, partial [Polyangiaceae bacterium]